jgi:hypothetical protein
MNRNDFQSTCHTHKVCSFGQWYLKSTLSLRILQGKYPTSCIYNSLRYERRFSIAWLGTETICVALPPTSAYNKIKKEESRVNPRLLSPPLLCMTAHRVHPLPQLPFGAPLLRPTGLKSSSACHSCGLQNSNPHRRSPMPSCLQAAARQLFRCLAGSRDCSLACPSSLHCHLPPMGTRFKETPPLPSTFSFRSSCGEERDGGCRI